MHRLAPSKTLLCQTWKTQSPFKKRAISSTLNHVGSDVLFMFSVRAFELYFLLALDIAKKGGFGCVVMQIFADFSFVVLEYSFQINTFFCDCYYLLLLLFSDTHTNPNYTHPGSTSIYSKIPLPRTNRFISHSPNRRSQTPSNWTDRSSRDGT
jgi:hypothetical protein